MPDYDWDDFGKDAAPVGLELGGEIYDTMTGSKIGVRVMWPLAVGVELGMRAYDEEGLTRKDFWQLLRGCSEELRLV